MLALSFLLLASRTDRPATDLVVRHVAVVDASSPRPRTGQTVVVRGGVIVAVGRDARVRVRPGSTVVDGRGRFLVPGLWEMHAHCWQAGPGALSKLVEAGVTSVRDVGGRLDVLDAWRAEIAEGTRVGPTIYRCGSFVDGPKDMDADRASATIVVKTPEEGRQAVRDQKARGVDFVKVHNGVDRDTFRAVADECKKVGLPLVVHLPRTGVRIEDASNWGARTLEHTETLIESELFADPQHRLTEQKAVARMTDERAKEVFKVLARNHTYFVPTLVEYHGMAEARKVNAPTVYESRMKVFKRLVELVRLMRACGVGVLPGSDFASESVPMRPGTSLHEEFGYLAQAGYTPREVLRMATVDAAKSMGQDGHVGLVRTGQTADLVLLSADPLSSVRNLGRIVAVVARGRLTKVSRKGAKAQSHAKAHPFNPGYSSGS